MTLGRRTLLIGLGVVAVYLVGASVSGHLSPLARRPLLDGLAPPQPYRWVSPPPPLAPDNEPPTPADATFAFDGGTFQGGVVVTNDQQATLILQNGSVPASKGQRSVQVTVDPVDPGTLGDAPPSLSFDGNAYRIKAAYRPGGASIPTLATAGDLALVYPADATFGAGSLKHVILASADGRSWQILSTTDLPTSHQASAKVQELGYFAVGRSGGGTARAPSRSFLPLLIAGAVVLLILLVTSPRVIRRFRDRGEREFGSS